MHQCLFILTVSAHHFWRHNQIPPVRTPIYDIHGNEIITPPTPRKPKQVTERDLRKIRKMVLWKFHDDCFDQCDNMCGRVKRRIEYILETATKEELIKLRDEHNANLEKENQRNKSN